MVTYFKFLNSNPVFRYRFLGPEGFCHRILQVVQCKKTSKHMSYSLNSFKGGYIGDYIGGYYRGY